MLGMQIAIGLGLMVITIMIHSIFMVGGAKLVRWRKSRFGSTKKDMQRALLLSLLVAWLFLAIALEAMIWALFYLWSPEITALPDLETAFYFSMVTFTTLGFGDVVLTGPWRTLASIQAANGVIIFGWTTALIFFYIQNVYKEE
jgi:hypothetical protein